MLLIDLERNKKHHSIWNSIKFTIFMIHSFIHAFIRCLLVFVWYKFMHESHFLISRKFFTSCILPCALLTLRHLRQFSFFSFKSSFFKFSSKLFSSFFYFITFIVTQNKSLEIFTWENFKDFSAVQNKMGAMKKTILLRLSYVYIYKMHNGEQVQRKREKKKFKIYLQNFTISNTFYRNVHVHAILDNLNHAFLSLLITKIGIYCTK